MIRVPGKSQKEGQGDKGRSPFLTTKEPERPLGDPGGTHGDPGTSFVTGTIGTPRSLGAPRSFFLKTSRDPSQPLGAAFLFKKAFV